MIFENSRVREIVIPMYIFYNCFENGSLNIIISTVTGQFLLCYVLLVFLFVLISILFIFDLNSIERTFRYKFHNEYLRAYAKNNVSIHCEIRYKCIIISGG